MIIGKKSFADVKIGDSLYFGSIDLSHIYESKVINIEMLPDEDDCFTIRSEVRFTPIEFGQFSISKCILDKNDAVYYTLPNGTGVYCGTSKEVVFNCVMDELNNKRKFWQDKINRFVDNY